MGATHEVENQVPPLEEINWFARDPVLRAGLEREGAGWAAERARGLGERLGTAEAIRWGFDANAFSPELKTHDRYGHRIDEVEFHPSYHRLMETAMEAGVHCLPWVEERAGGHVARAVLMYLMNQVESGTSCPLTMTAAVVPALKSEAGVAEEWVGRVTQMEYDPRSLPAGEKRSCTMGMAMTEKQGGSDVRANTTQAVATDASREAFLLTGHKWFCSAPMCDAFLTLGYTEEGLTCFLVPRWTPEGERNPLNIQRLKNKLGNKSNASSEIEYRETWARRVGPEGRGVATILTMVQHTRLDCVTGSAGILRAALAQAHHHARHRKAFGKVLIRQPLMQSVLADLAVESETSTTLALRLARAYDEGDEAFARLATAVGKYWVCKRTPTAVFEAMECLGGNGYVEDSGLPRMYREAPVNSIWEGSGNVICLDVMRALQRSPESGEAFVAELEGSRGSDRRLDGWIDEVKEGLSKAELGSARWLVERMALSLQGAVLAKVAPDAVLNAFLEGRSGGLVLGSLPGGVDREAIVERIAED